MLLMERGAQYPFTGLSEDGGKEEGQKGETQSERRGDWLLLLVVVVVEGEGGDDGEENN